MPTKRVIGKKHSAMTPAQLAKTKKEDPQARAFAEMEAVFSAAASIDAIKIFYAAKEGISSSTQAIKELDLTQKRYYTNLKRLIDTGLVEKVDGTYKHTTLGKISYKLVEAFKSAVNQRDRLDLVDRLTRAKNITVEETEEIMRAILKDIDIVTGDRITDLLGPVKMADTWDKVVHDVVEYIDNAEESVYFATQYFDTQVAEAVVRACGRRVKMYLLTNEKDGIVNRLNLVLRSILLNPKTLKSLVSLLSSPDISVKYVDIPYTFLIIDQKTAMVEVPQPYTKSFSMGFFFHNEKLSQRLIESFNLLWKKGTNVKSIISKSIEGFD